MGEFIGGKVSFDCGSGCLVGTVTDAWIAVDPRRLMYRVAVSDGVYEVPANNCYTWHDS